MFRHGSCFSGIGGFEYAAGIMGWENVFHCEYNSFAKNVLRYYWPKAISYDDIRKTDFSKHRGEIDILTGGFPCQPYSSAGKRKGKNDERHLWPEMLRAIREIAPSWVVGENVLGLASWSGGLVFEEVHADLEAEGYTVQAYVLPAAGVSAPHQRYRIFFIAYSDRSAILKKDNRREEYLPHHGEEIRSFDHSGGSFITNPNSIGELEYKATEEGQQFGSGWPAWRGAEGSFLRGTASDSGSSGFEKRYSPQKPGRSGLYTRRAPINWTQWPTERPVCHGDDGISARLDITSLFEGAKSRRGDPFSRWRNESIKAGGNAIVPQVALQIFKAIQEYDNLINSQKK